MFALARAASHHLRHCSKALQFCAVPCLPFPAQVRILCSSSFVVELTALLSVCNDSSAQAVRLLVPLHSSEGLAELWQASPRTSSTRLRRHRHLLHSQLSPPPAPSATRSANIVIASRLSTMPHTSVSIPPLIPPSPLLPPSPSSSLRCGRTSTHSRATRMPPSLLVGSVSTHGR